MITKGTTLGATRFITVTTTIEAEMRAVELTATGVEIVPAAMKETITLLEDTPNLAVRAASARVPSATTTMADRKGVFRHAEVPASAAEEARGAAVAAGIDH